MLKFLFSGADLSMCPFPSSDNAGIYELSNGERRKPARYYLRRKPAGKVMVISRAHNLTQNSVMDRRRGSPNYVCLDCGASGEIAELRPKKCKPHGEAVSSGYSGIIIDENGPCGIILNNKLVQ